MMRCYLLPNVDDEALPNYAASFVQQMKLNRLQTTDERSIVTVVGTQCHKTAPAETGWKICTHPTESQKRKTGILNGFR